MRRHGKGRALPGTQEVLVGIAVLFSLRHHCACHCHLPSLLPCPLPPCPTLCACSAASLQILWTFSIYLESVAILPQLFMVSKTGEAETITSHYLFALGVYRTLYLFNWIWRYYFEGFFDLIAIVAGLVQTVLYCDFFYLYITKGSQRGGQLKGVLLSPQLPPSIAPALHHSEGGGFLSWVPGPQALLS